LQFLSATNGANTIHFGDGSSADAYRGYINYNHTSDRMEFATSGTERMRIDSSGNVGIGNTSPSPLYWPNGSTGGLFLQAGALLSAYNAGTNLSQNYYYNAGEKFIGNGGASRYVQSGQEHIWSHSTAVNSSGAGAGLTWSESMRIDSSGNVGIGVTSILQGYKLEVDGNIVIPSGNFLANRRADGGNYGLIRGNDSGTTILGDSQSVHILSSGNVGIGVTAPTTKLHLGDNDHLGFGTGSATKPDFRISFVTATNSLGIKCGTGGDAVDVTLSVTGDLTIAGALSKGSGSFKIDHPLESKKDTHHLVHSFVEAPQADNIYRGKVDLVDGSATVNIDTIAGMTEGTFIALNTNVQCFTSNESDWDAVKGSVSENILTISCQNTSSTATVSWLVIGERHDQHMKDTGWTDANGKVIVEPLQDVK
jgi:hypothetical protein